MNGRTEGTARSVHVRLVRHAREQNLDPNQVLVRYGVERFLYRLSESVHADRFVLKGALLLLAWTADTLRPTRDADLLGFGDLSDDKTTDLFREVCVEPVVDDGMRYDPSTVAVTEIRQDDAYGGKRVTLTGRLGSGQIRIQVDIGIGDVAVPPPEWLELPGVLDLPRARLRAYRPETVVAEKLHAMVTLGYANSRMRDFFDAHVLSATHEFTQERLALAISSTFAARKTAIPGDLPLALTPQFGGEEDKQEQWAAFLRRTGVDAPVRLLTVTAALSVFLEPVLTQAREERRTAALWQPGGPWVEPASHE